MAVEVPDFSHPNIHNFHCQRDLRPLVNSGYDSCIISIPETVAAKEAIRAIESGFKRILLDKPGASSSSELVRVQQTAERYNAQVFMNYQRKMDPTFSDRLFEIEKMKRAGYKLDYVSVYSCDAK